MQHSLIGAAQAKINDLLSLLNEAKQENTQACEKIEALIAKIEESETKIENLFHELCDKEKAHAEKIEILLRENAGLKEAEVRAEAAKERIAKLLKRLDDYRQENAKAQDKIEGLATQATSLIQELRGEEKLHAQKVEALQQENTRLLKQLAMFEKMSKKME